MRASFSQALRARNPRTLTAQEATALANTRYSPADIAFMRGMITHHLQAVEMANLVERAPTVQNWSKLPAASVQAKPTRSSSWRAG